MKYDIFISYRRSDFGKEKAFPIATELENLGYRVFLDLNEIHDGAFSTVIMDALSSAPVFISLLTANSLDRCINEDDWVRKEIQFALKSQKHIIFINPDGEFKAAPNGIPHDIKTAVEEYQHSDISFGSLFKLSIKKMAEERVRPYVKMDMRTRLSSNKYLISISAFVIIAVLILTITTINRNRIINEDVRIHMSLLSSAITMLNSPDSLKFAESIVLEATAIKEKYKYSKLSERFSANIELLNDYNHIKDSLYDNYVNKYNFHYQQYMNNPAHEEKELAVYYLDKALSLKYDKTLELKKAALSN